MTSPTHISSYLPEVQPALAFDALRTVSRWYKPFISSAGNASVKLACLEADRWQTNTRPTCRKTSDLSENFELLQVSSTTAGKIQNS